ncbi:MAG: ATP-binding protein [Ignavibacteriales bacterium]|nr:ATP-binding protein [Ignavibacteriales bacterium]
MKCQLVFDTTKIKKGKIDFTFDTFNQRISVRDNGIGINVEQLKRILKPNVTYKYGSDFLRGEKGVGLTFILFSTNNFEIETSNGKEKIDGKVKNAFDWVKSKVDEVPKLEMSIEKENGSPFTEFKLGGISSIMDDFNLFEFNIGKLKYILRTKTAAGNTASLFNQQPRKDIEISLTYIDEKNKSTIEKVPYGFDAPHNYIKPNISFDERKEKKANGQDEKVRGKAVYKTDKTRTKSGREIKYYYFVCSRYKYYEMSKNILGYDDKELVEGRIYLSTKNMPTGIEISPPTVGKAGYWANNLYIIMEYDDLDLDMGRKSVSGRIVKMIRDEAEKIYKELQNHFSDIVDTDDITEDTLESQEQIEEIWDSLSSVDNLNAGYLNYFKVPLFEQGVVAVFHELVGAKKLHGYQTWRTNMKDTYDEFVKYKSGKRDYKILIEFKFDAADIIKDITDGGKKEYSKIQLLVCWDIDIKKFKSEGYDVIDNEEETPFFNGTTHKISIPQIKNQISVICLKKFLEQESKKK